MYFAHWVEEGAPVSYHKSKVVEVAQNNAGREVLKIRENWKSKVI